MGKNPAASPAAGSHVHNRKHVGSVRKGRPRPRRTPACRTRPQAMLRASGAPLDDRLPGRGWRRLEEIARSGTPGPQGDAGDRRRPSPQASSKGAAASERADALIITSIPAPKRLVGFHVGKNYTRCPLRNCRKAAERSPNTRHQEQSSPHGRVALTPAGALGQDRA